jgi:hypothetical protein
MIPKPPFRFYVFKWLFPWFCILHGKHTSSYEVLLQFLPIFDSYLDPSFNGYWMAAWVDINNLKTNQKDSKSNQEIHTIKDHTIRRHANK